MKVTTMRFEESRTLEIEKIARRENLSLRFCWRSLKRGLGK